MCACPGDVTSGALRVSGTIPPSLYLGTYVLNGPGQIVVGGRRVHSFDGSGYVRAVSLDNSGGASLRGRFVRTPTYCAEAAAGRVVHRGLGTNTGAFWRRSPSQPRNVANTTVTPWAGQLLCGWEGGLPWALRPGSLDTVGEGGALATALAGGSGGVLAHMRIDNVARRLVCLQVSPGVSETVLRFIEVDEQGERVSVATAAVPYMLMCHDFFVTPRCYVVFGNRLRLRVAGALAMMVGVGTMIDAVAADLSQPVCLHIFPRDAGGVAEGAVLKGRTVVLDRPLFCAHLANAFDAHDGTLVVDLCGYSSMGFGDEFGYRGPHRPYSAEFRDFGSSCFGRAVVAPEAATASFTLLSSLYCDFPRVSQEAEGTDAHAVFVAARDPKKMPRYGAFNAIARITVRGSADSPRPPDDVWVAEGSCVFTGEPVVVCSGGDSEGGGYVLACTYDGSADGGETQLCIFDAHAVAAGPVARIHFGRLFPMGLHGHWLARDT